MVLAVTALPAAWAQSTAAAKTETAIFAGGCFWCVEADFDKLAGVLTTTSGYIGGRKANPTYSEVSAGGTGHTEAVRVEFDPARVSYAQLVEKFWPTIDPTVKDQQFCDVGSQYRSGIYRMNDAQLKIAQASKAALERTKPFTQPIVTEIAMADVLPRRGIPPGLLHEESDPLRLLPQGLRPRCAAEGAVGQQGAGLNATRPSRHWRSVAAAGACRRRHCVGAIPVALRKAREKAVGSE